MTDLYRYLLLWLIGISMRVTQLALAPLIPEIRIDLGLNSTAVGILGTLPLLLFAAGAIAGSLIIFRFGVRQAIITGLIAIAAFSALRGAFGATAFLFAGTVGMGLGIALLQPSMPTLVKNWLPQKIGVATAVYTNGLLIGQTLGAGLTLPLIKPLAGGAWTGALAGWSVLVVVVAILFVIYRASETTPLRASTRWLPDWSDRRTWQIGILLGSGSSIYFAANTFLPDILHQSGRSALIAQTLGAMSLFQIPAPLLVLFFSKYLIGSRTPFITTGIVALAASLLILVSSGREIVILAGILGFCTAFILTLCLALPPWLVPQEKVHYLSAGMFAVAYGCAVIYPVLGGAVWDFTGQPLYALIPNIVGLLVVIGMGFIVDLRRD